MSKLVNRLLKEPSSDMELENIAYTSGIKLAGVISKDQVSGLVKKPGAWVVNLDDLSGPGTHWCALIITSRTPHSIKGEWFDSYGMPPPECIVKLSMNGIIRFNDWQLQTLPEQSCGLYCLAFIKLSQSGTGFDEIVEKRFTAASSPSSAKKNSKLLLSLLN